MLLVRRSHFQDLWAKVKVSQRMRSELRGQTVSVFLGLGGWGWGEWGARGRIWKRKLSVLKPEQSWKNGNICITLNGGVLALFPLVSQ